MALGNRTAGAAVANPIAFFFAFRWLTWLLAAFIIGTGSVPQPNMRFEPGVLMVAAVQLALGMIYSLSSRRRYTAEGADGPSPYRPHDLIAVGLADMVGSLTMVYFTGAWGSPFWHYAVTSLLVPCFLLPPRWGMATVAGYVAAYIFIVGIGARGLDDALEVGSRNFFIGNVITAILVAVAVSYLGALFQTLQTQRLRTRQALEETETLFGLAENVVRSGTDAEDLINRVSQLVRTSGRFDQYAVVSRNGQGQLELHASNVGLEELPMELAQQAVKENRTVVSQESAGWQWQAAVPLEVGGQVWGAVVAGAIGPGQGVARSRDMLEAIASQVGVGLQNAYLAQERTEMAAQEERVRMAREIHDGIAQAIYMLALQLETCADLARDRPHDLGERLDQLVALSKQTLLEVRHYIFDLKPYLAGEQGIASMVENQVREFSKVAGVPATVSTDGAERPVAVPVATCLYRVTQEALANALKHARASRLEVALDFRPASVCLTVNDDGRGFDPQARGTGYGVENMIKRAEELGGSLHIASAPGKGTQVVLELPA